MRPPEDRLEEHEAHPQGKECLPGLLRCADRRKRSSKRSSVDGSSMRIMGVLCVYAYNMCMTCFVMRLRASRLAEVTRHPRDESGSKKCSWLPV